MCLREAHAAHTQRENEGENERESERESALETHATSKSVLDVCVREPIMDPVLDVCVREPIMLDVCEREPITCLSGTHRSVDVRRRSFGRWV